MKTPTCEHWCCTLDDSRVAWIGFDHLGESVNILSKQAIDELSSIVHWLETRVSIKGAIFYSKKSTGFIAGADVKNFMKLESQEQAWKLVTHVQGIFDRIAALSIPTMAMIEGFCLGGGTELALACRYRIMAKDTEAKIGLPEVKLGIHPGWGGTVRLPQLIGIVSAMPCMLSGRLMSAKQAKS